MRCEEIPGDRRRVRSDRIGPVAGARAADVGVAGAVDDPEIEQRLPLCVDVVRDGVRIFVEAERAGRIFPKTPVISRRPDKSLHRYTYADMYRRSRQLAKALVRAGLKPGDRVATLMWNHYAHLEAYFGVPAAGGVLHTLNLRLFPEDIAYIVNHAKDRFLIVDDCLLPLFEKFKGEVKLDRVIVFGF